MMNRSVLLLVATAVALGGCVAAQPGETVYSDSPGYSAPVPVPPVETIYRDPYPSVYPYPGYVNPPYYDSGPYYRRPPVVVVPGPGIIDRPGHHGPNRGWSDRDGPHQGWRDGNPGRPGQGGRPDRPAPPVVAIPPRDPAPGTPTGPPLGQPNRSGFGYGRPMDPGVAPSNGWRERPGRDRSESTRDNNPGRDGNW